jgi:outer membrane protein assembly factor BamE
MSRSSLPLILASSLLLGACSNVPQLINPYKIDVQQGNVLSQEMVSQLKPGQTREQVRFLLGSPMLTDVFHQQRWDYVYRYQNGTTGQVESRKFSVFFDQANRLERVAGDVEVGGVSDLTAPVASTRVVDLGEVPADAAGKPLPPVEERSYYRRFMDMIGL